MSQSLISGTGDGSGSVGDGPAGTHNTTVTHRGAVSRQTKFGEGFNTELSCLNLSEVLNSG